MKTFAWLRIAIIFSFMTVVLSGCSTDNNQAGAEEGKANIEIDEVGSQAVDAEPEEDEVSRPLIIYFDYSENVDTTGQDVDAISSATLRTDATENNTGKLIAIVDEIKAVKDADVFSIQVNETYAPKYDDMVGQAKQDISDDKNFTFRSDLIGLDGYETIYFVTPIWWGELPQPVQVFFEQYDFSGKTIIPVVVHRGSGFGRTVSQMQEFEPDAIVLDGVAISADIDNSVALENIDELLGK